MQILGGCGATASSVLRPAPDTEEQIHNASIMHGSASLLLGSRHAFCMSRRHWRCSIAADRTP
eukprot:5164028-Pyramimonas_sp.AAC.1